ncbi:family 10 glycosylhydrolase [Clostridium sp. SYSU_GA19001]|uniref:family 10 glycosylhydrolase n=1 Tax=Clostridium caldaquaticum TaxID=2940653 RepID=UPI00207762C0|nr:family 10 glycosylhydrolase [Clostridium caldaquaticum]MCM8712097.1 family 10 glycosylhydrolase [Clostridium caldaquaticum]
MKEFFKRYKLYLIIIIIAASGLLFYFKVNSKKEAPAINKTVPSINKVKSFNSLVSGIFILNETGESYGAVENIFASVGYDIAEGSFEDYKKLKGINFILIVPEKEAALLDSEKSTYISEKIKTGQKLITWGKTYLSKELGITFLNGNKEINGYTWNNESKVPITFKNSAVFELFSIEGNFKVLAEEKDKNPVMAAVSYGKGNFIYSGISLVGSSGLSYDYFPLITEAVKEEFKIMPSFARDDLAFYVDISYHTQDTPEDIAQKVKSYGGNQINLSAWYSPEKYGNLYKEIIDACHKRGIEVFAWFELPLVSIEFWDKHPEWREKTASGKDAFIDWRRLMALSNPEALEEIKKYTESFIKSFDWDGVDIAEIYFESPGKGFKDMSKFTPMNDSFRQAFKEKYGVDPKKAFNPFSRYYWIYNKEMKQNIIDYRVELVTKLHEEFLQLCENIKKEKPYLKTNVTVIDSIADKSMRENIGVDAQAIAKLQDKYHFILEIEDPFTLWNLGPDRYKVIGEEYRDIMSEGNQLSIDINVIDRGGEVYPTKKQRGVELYQLINNASKYTDKVILYALATFEKTDMELAPYTRSSDIKVQEVSENEYIIKADKRFIWNVNTEGKTYYIDGEKWPFVSKQGVIIPGGEHKLKIKDIENSSELFIESISGEITDVSQDKNLSFSYTSEGRFYMIVNKKPAQIKLDGYVFNAEIKQNNDKYVIVLPKGKHKAVLYK